MKRTLTWATDKKLQTVSNMMLVKLKVATIKEVKNKAILSLKQKSHHY